MDMSVQPLREPRHPSERQFAARYANAVRVAEKVSCMIADGYRVHDEDGDTVERVDIGPTGDIIFVMRDGGRILRFMNDRTFDNGGLDTIAEFNAGFADWTYIHPRNIRRLKL